MNVIGGAILTIWTAGDNLVGRTFAVINQWMVPFVHQDFGLHIRSAPIGLFFISDGVLAIEGSKAFFLAGVAVHIQFEPFHGPIDLVELHLLKVYIRLVLGREQVHDNKPANRQKDGNDDQHFNEGEGRPTVWTFLNTSFQDLADLRPRGGENSSPGPGRSPSDTKGQS